QASAAAPAQSSDILNPSVSRVTKMSTNGIAAGLPTQITNPDLVYVNGIDFETGTYAIPPRSIEDVAKAVRLHPGATSVAELHEQRPRSFGLPFDVDAGDLMKAGWGVIFHPDTAQEVRTALAPLIAARKAQAGTRFKELEYRTGEQTREWYQRHGISPGG